MRPARGNRLASGGSGEGLRAMGSLRTVLVFIWLWAKSQIVPPVNIRFNPTTKIGSKMGAPTPTRDPKRF